MCFSSASENALCNTNRVVSTVRTNLRPRTELLRFLGVALNLLQGVLTFVQYGYRQCVPDYARLYCQNAHLIYVCVYISISISLFLSLSLCICVYMYIYIHP